jgi:hypothetical protein
MHARPDKQITRVGALPQLLADNRPAQLTIELTIFQRSTPHLLAHDPVLLQERLHGTPKHPLQLPERPRGQLRCGRAHWGLRPVPPCSRPHTLSTPWWLPARPFPSSIFLDKNRSDIGKSQSIRTDSKMETAGSLLSCHEQLLQLTLITKHRAPLRCDPSSSPQSPPQRSHPAHQRHRTWVTAPPARTRCNRQSRRPHHRRCMPASLQRTYLLIVAIVLQREQQLVGCVGRR